MNATEITKLINRKILINNMGGVFGMVVGWKLATLMEEKGVFKYKEPNNISDGRVC